MQPIDPEKLPQGRVRVDELVISDSPRLAGENYDHVRTLAESEAKLPPIIVHIPSMRVIDGVHRLLAARLRGYGEVDVRFFDGDDASSFVLAVHVNIAHGLPLTLADRKAAASRIISAYPQWSDRLVATVTGISAKTVAAIRDQRPSAENQHLDSRVGRDGRARPVNQTERRRLTARLLHDNPDASLREIARSVGVSPETVRQMRARLSADHSESTIGQPSGDTTTQSAQRGRSWHDNEDETRDTANGVSSFRSLQADPAFRYTDTGRSLLRFLSAYQVIQQNGAKIIDTVPAHCLANLAEVARACADSWQEFADYIDKRQNSIS
jgi:transposase-like protein